MSESVERTLHLARHYAQVQRPDEALAILERAEEAALAQPDYWILRGAALLDLGRKDQARSDIGRGLEIAPESVALLHLMSMAETRCGDLAGAERHLLEALRVAPESPDLLVAYGDLVARAGQFDKARRLLERAEGMHPEHPDLTRARYLLATLEGRDAEAAKQARAWVADDPMEARAHAAMGFALGTLGRHADGRRHLEEAASLEPRIVEGMEEDFRDAHSLGRAALLPLWPITRFGPIRIWMGAIALMLLLQAIGWPRMAGAFAVLYVLYCVYSWVAPPLVRRLTSRGGR